MSNLSPTMLLLNLGHALDHLFLLIFATAVGAIAAEFGMAWTDLMPYAAGAFVLFGLGSLPAGWLGDHWGRRRMMVVFFVGIGAASILVANTRSPVELAAALTLLGAFAAIYHPVGIAMVVQNAKGVGFTIGVNGLAGNLGIALAAILTGVLVKEFGWRTAFVVPGALSIACGLLFHLIAEKEREAPAKRAPKLIELPRGLVARVFAVMTATAICSSLAFNFTTNGNTALFLERIGGLAADPAAVGAVLAVVYAVASLAQLVVGKLIDRYPIRSIYLPIALLQAPTFYLAANAQDWAMVASATLFMILVFGQIPFADALVTRYFDDRMRSRVYATRLTISFGASSAAVALLGPIAKAGGFASMLELLALIGAATALLVLALPKDRPAQAAPAVQAASI